MTTKPSTEMAMEMLEAFAVIGERHGLNPHRLKDRQTLLLTFGAVLMAILKTGDPAARGLTVRDETRKGIPGTGMTIHHDEEGEAA